MIFVRGGGFASRVTAAQVLLNRRVFGIGRDYLDLRDTLFTLLDIGVHSRSLNGNDTFPSQRELESPNASKFSSNNNK